MAGGGAMAFKFKRCFSDDALRKLKEEPLFRERLYNDIVGKRNVLPAVRTDRGDL